MSPQTMSIVLLDGEVPRKLQDMRTIRVSTEIFATIWKARLPGENSEGAILARLLGVQDAGSSGNRRKHEPLSKTDEESDWIAEP